jgi:hypothetical protein
MKTAARNSNVNFLGELFLTQGQSRFDAITMPYFGMDHGSGRGIPTANTGPAKEGKIMVLDTKVLFI